MRKAIELLFLLTCAGCSDNSQTASKPDPTAVFSLRTECGKMGEAWLMRHPIRTPSYPESEEAKILYNSAVNRCWLIVTHLNYHYSLAVGMSPRVWPEWAVHQIRKDVTEENQTLYDIQTGARIMMCRLLDYVGYGDDCRYIQKTEASDL